MYVNFFKIDTLKNALKVLFKLQTTLPDVIWPFENVPQLLEGTIIIKSEFGQVLVYFQSLL